MITPSDIQAAIKERLQKTFPGEVVYEDLTPRNFTRPSNLVELSRITVEQAGSSVVRFLFQYKINTFAEVDDIHNTHLAVLDFRSMMILTAFSDPRIKVLDRSPAISSCVADTSGYDYATVTLTVAHSYDRSELTPEEIYPIMEDLALRTKTKEDSEA